MADLTTFENPINDIDHPKSLDPLQNYSLDDENATVHEVNELFKRVANNEGKVDREGLAKLMRALSLPSEPLEIDGFFSEIAEAGAQSVSLEQFVPWFQAKDGSFAQEQTSFNQARTRSARVGKKVLKPASKLKNKLIGGEDERLGRGVAPESMFLIDQNGNSEMREQADLRGQLHLRYESDFHHLRDLIINQDDDTNYQEAFDEINAELFDEVSADKSLGWPADCIEAAKQVFARKDQTDMWRHFVQSGPKLGSKTGSFPFQTWDGGASNDTTHAAELAARAYLTAADGPLAKVINKETLPFDQAFQAVHTALVRELASQRLKVSDLEQRLENMMVFTEQKNKGVEPPRKLRFSGLRGEAAAANGTYCVEGLRCYWGRPLYARVPDSGGGSTNPYFLFFTKTYQPGEMLADGTTPQGKWSDGVWVLGPTLNSERCTAFLEDSGEDDMLYPVSTRNLDEDRERYGPRKWNVFDVVAKSWADAPGRHCPSFRMQLLEEPGANLSEYVRAAIEDQKQSAKQFERLVEDQEVQETLRLTLKGHADAAGNVSRGAVLSWRKNLYRDELRDKQTLLRETIVADRSLSQTGTEDERRHIVEEVISSFVGHVQKEMTARDAAKRKFFARVSRPTLSRAFFTWKFACRQSSMAAMPSSGLFAEPHLPWNIRHPRSRFTTMWEVTQAIILIYAAFSIIWRVCFNSPATGVLAVVELVVDTFFVMDIVLNLHTAYYDASGDLVGLARSGRSSSVVWRILSCGSGADLRRTYAHYARGWFVIDFISVFPFGWVSERLWPNTAKSGADARFLKALRLLRISKLLRLARCVPRAVRKRRYLHLNLAICVDGIAYSDLCATRQRGMRIFKKYEEELGPVVSATVLVGTVILVLHIIACVWFLVGTSRSFHTNHECTSDECEDVIVAESTGWIEMHFGLSEVLCGCHEDEDGNSFFYDAYEDFCLHPLNLSAPIESVCDGAMRPDPWTYYKTALFKAMQDTPIGDGYLHSTNELWTASLITALFGFLWGAVAGCWSTIFAANALAGQEFRMKMLQIKEFCRLKALDWGTRAKLLAYYEQLYPEGVIIDEQEILNDLPPTMKIELARQIYGGIILAVPLFFGLDASVLTEICLALVPLPVMKGEVILREGQKGAEMYCIQSGKCRVTQHMSIGNDEERVRIWIEEVFGAHGKTLRLYEPNQRKLLHRLLKQIQSHGWAQEQQARLSPKARPTGSKITIAYRDLLKDDSLISSFRADRSVVDPTATLQSLLAAAKKYKCVSYHGALRLSQNADGTYDDGPAITLEKATTGHIAWQSSRQMLCSALRDGVVLCQLLNFFIGFPKIEVQTENGALQLITGLASDAAAIGDSIVTGTAEATIRAADKGASMVPNAMASKQLQKGVSGINKIQENTVGRATGVANSAASVFDDQFVGSKRNVVNFLGVLSSVERSFNTGDLIVQSMSASGAAGQHLFKEEDLLLHNQGTPQEQAEKETRVLSCLLELASTISSLDGYMGIMLDEMNLGTLTAGEFFGEMALLPLQTEWRHRRTTTSAGNSMLYYLTRQNLDYISAHFPDLKHKLHDHAEDYEKMHGSNTFTQQFSNLNVNDDQSATKSTTEVDPLNLLTEQLSQMDSKQADQDLKLAQLDTKLTKLVDMIEMVAEKL